MSMYHVLLVDDEHFVIRGINSCVNWEANGFCPPVEAYSGEQALEILEAGPVDIVFTDIKMATMSGLDLLAEIKARGYDCEIIILSCHNDFAYSRQALQNGAFDYLFKPEMLPEDILAAALGAKERLEERRRAGQSIEHLRQRLTQSLEYERETFLRALADGKRLAPAAFLEEAGRLELPITTAAVNILVLRLLDYKRVLAETYHGDEYLFKYGVLNVLREASADIEGCVLFARSIGEYAFICNDSSSDARVTAGLRSLALAVFAGLEKAMGLKVSAGAGPLHQSAEQFQATYEAAAASVRGGLKGGVITFAGGGAAREAEALAGLRQAYREWEGTPEEKVRRLFGEIQAMETVPRDGLIDLCCGIISLELQRQPAGQEGGDSGRKKLFASLYDQHSLEEFEARMLEFAAGLLLGGRREIRLAQGYLAQNLAQPGLNLAEVAAHVGMSKNYFSDLFKRETGVGFSEYLNDLRLQRAEELYATTNLKIYQIAEQVGYADWRYLTRVYKKQRGRNLTETGKKSTYSE